MKRLLSVILLLCLTGIAGAQEEEAVGAVTPGSGLVQVQDRVRLGRSPSRGSQYFPGANVTGSDLELFNEQQTPWTSASAGHPLTRGSRVRSGAQGATISMVDGVELRLDKDTAIEVVDRDRVKVLRGQVWLKTERPLKLLTGRRQVNVLGTELVLSAGATESTLTVLEGRAEMASTRVEAGQELTLKGDELGSPVASVKVEGRPAWVRETTVPANLGLSDLLAGRDRDQVRAGSLETLESDPGNVEARLDLAALYLEESRLEEAERQLEGLSSSARKSRLQSRLALLRGNYDQVDQSNPDDALVALYAQGKKAEAEKLLRARVADSNDPSGLAALAYLVEYPRGHYREAAALLQQALEQQPDNALYHQHLGDVYAAMSRNAAAMDELKKSFELSNGSASSALRLGSLASKLGYYQEAVTYLDRFRRGEVSRETDIHHALALGYGYLQSGDSQKALEQAERALQLADSVDPGLKYLAYDLQGIVLSERGSLRAAAESYNQALTQRPGDPFLLNDLGLSLRALGDLYQAQAKLREARDQAPDSPIIRGNLAFVYYLLNQPQRSLTEASKALHQNPDNASLVYQFGVSTQQFGRIGQSSLVRQSRLLDPLLNTRSRPRALLVAGTSPDSGPFATAVLRGRLGDRLAYVVAAGGLNSFAIGDASNDADSLRGELGWRLTPADSLAMFYERQRSWTDTVGTESFGSFAQTELGYRRELSPDAALWLLVRYRDDYTLSNGLAALNDVRALEGDVEDTRYELRLDWDASPDHRLSFGYSGANTDVFSQTATFSRFLQQQRGVDQDLHQFWLQDDWSMSPNLRFVFGGNWRHASYSERTAEFGFSGNRQFFPADFEESVIDPFAALTWNYSLGSELSLSYVQTSAQDRFGPNNYFEPAALLQPVNISSTSLFPSPGALRDGVFENTLAGVADLQDLRFRLAHDFGPNLFATLEYGHVEARRPNFLGQAVSFESRFLSLDPINLNIFRGEQHSLDNLRFDLEFWDGGDTAGIFSYNHRDYNVSSGPNDGRPWIGVPQDELDLRVFRRINSQLGFTLRPVYQSEIPLDLDQGLTRGDAFRLDASVTWSPLPDSTIEVGYQNIFNDKDSPQKSGVFTNLVIQY